MTDNDGVLVNQHTRATRTQALVVPREEFIAHYLPNEAKPVYRQQLLTYRLERILTWSVLLWCIVAVGVIIGSTPWQWLLSGVGVVGLTVAAYHVGYTLHDNPWLPALDGREHYFVRDSVVDGGTELSIVGHRRTYAFDETYTIPEVHRLTQFMNHHFDADVSAEDIDEYRDMLIQTTASWNHHNGTALIEAD